MFELDSHRFPSTQVLNGRDTHRKKCEVVHSTHLSTSKNMHCNNSLIFDETPLTLFTLAFEKIPSLEQLKHFFSHSFKCSTQYGDNVILEKSNPEHCQELFLRSVLYLLSDELHLVTFRVESLILFKGSPNLVCARLNLCSDLIYKIIKWEHAKIAKGPYLIMKRKRDNSLFIGLIPHVEARLCKLYGYGAYSNQKPAPRGYLIHLNDADIYRHFAKEAKAISKWLSHTHATHKVKRLLYFAYCSFLRTMAQKYRQRVSEMAKKAKNLGFVPFSSHSFLSNRYLKTGEPYTLKGVRTVLWEIDQTSQQAIDPTIHHHLKKMSMLLNDSSNVEK